MDARVTTTMAACTSTAQQIIHIESRLDQMVIALQLIANNTAQSTSAAPTTKTRRPTISIAPSLHSQAHHGSDDEDSLSLELTQGGGSSNASMNTTNSKSTSSSRNKSPEEKGKTYSNQSAKQEVTRHNPSPIRSAGESIQLKPSP
jgi:hypothetical protein